MEVRKYRNSPIEEAVCDIQFAPKTDWDPTLPGLMYEKLKKACNEKPRQVQFFEAPAHGVKTEGMAGPPFVQGILKQRAQLLADNAARIVGIGADQLSVHMLRPYSGWYKFRGMIRRA